MRIYSKCFGGEWGGNTMDGVRKMFWLRPARRTNMSLRCAL